MLFFVEGNILVPVSHLSLAIIMVVTLLSFCICSLPGHIDRAKKLLMDVKEHSSTILHGFSAFCIDNSVHVYEHLKENLMSHCIVNVECISLVVEVDPIQ